MAFIFVCMIFICFYSVFYIVFIVASLPKSVKEGIENMMQVGLLVSKPTDSKPSCTGLSRIDESMCRMEKIYIHSYIYIQMYIDMYVYMYLCMTALCMYIFMYIHTYVPWT